MDSTVNCEMYFVCYSGNALGCDILAEYEASIAENTCVGMKKNSQAIESGITRFEALS